jgi:predicted porin
MNKSLGLILLASLCTASAQAQPDVTVYGAVDMGLVRESGGAAGSVTNLNSGIASGSRLGFKGKEDLGGGLRAQFVIESGFNADTGAAGQGGLLFGRQAFVGLGGQLGTLTLGRQYSPYYKALRDTGDPFGAVSLAGRAGNLMATNTRVDNLAEYVSPNVNGIQADLAYGAGEVAGDSARNRTLSGALAYAGTALHVQLAMHQLTNAAATDHSTNSLLAANYRFGMLTAYASYARTRGTGTVDSRDMLAGISAPLGTATLLLSHVRHDDRAPADKDASQWGIACLYPLSKRTDLYASYASIDNRHGASFTVGNATDKGSGNRALDLGLRHLF